MGLSDHCTPQFKKHHKSRSLQVRLYLTHLNKCRRMLDLSIIFPEVGSFTGSDIISWVIGSRNSSGG